MAIVFPFFFHTDSAPANDRGKIKIKLPAGTKAFRLAVKADKYVTFRDRIEVAEKVEVQMKSGRVIKVRATNEKNKLLPDAFPIVDSGLGSRTFAKQADGTHVSPMLSPDRRWMWVVDGSDPDEPILFSDLIDLQDDMVVDEDGLVQPQLKIGTRLEGVLGDEVPRPIKNGYVHVFVGDGENHRIGKLKWKEHAKIQPDGSFVFESLPRATHAQIFAICDGWQSKSPTNDSIEAYCKKYDAANPKWIAAALDRDESKPQIYHLDSSNSPVQITVPCRQSTALDVRVVDPTGNPIVGAKVSMSPNLAFIGKLVIPGCGWSTAAIPTSRSYSAI